MSGYLTGVLVLLSFNVIAAYAVYLPLATGQLNLGIAGFMAIGAYCVAFLSTTLGWPILVAVVIATLVATVVALAVAVPVLRTHGIYLALATFALGQVIAAALLNLEFMGGAAGFPVSANIGAKVVFGAAIGVTILLLLLSQTRFALYLTAIKVDATVSDLMGINVRAIQIASFVIGAAIAGFGGSLYAFYFNFIEAQYFNVLLSVYPVLYVLLGGTQTVFGPLAGAVFFTLLPEALRASQEWRYAIFAAAIVLFMAIRPEGLITASLVRRIRRAVGRGSP